MLLRAALPLLLLASCASQPENKTPVLNPASPGVHSLRKVEFLGVEESPVRMPQSTWPTLPELQAAADAGQGGALFELGDAYELGLGVKPDLAKAQELYRQAGARGEPRALVRLGWGHQTGIWGKADIAAALDAYVAADALSCREASLALARLFAEGADGAPKSEAMAEYWYRRAIQVFDEGETSRFARRFMVRMTARELMALLDRKQDALATGKMEKLWEECFEGESDWDASWILANRYLKGIGTPCDGAKALSVLEDREGWRCCLIRAQIYEHGQGVSRDLDKALQNYHAAWVGWNYDARAPYSWMRLKAGRGDVASNEFGAAWLRCYWLLPQTSNRQEVCDQLLAWQKSSQGKWASSYGVMICAALLGAEIPWDHLQEAAKALTPPEKKEVDWHVLQGLNMATSDLHLQQRVLDHLRTEFSETEWGSLTSPKSLVPVRQLPRLIAKGEVLPPPFVELDPWRSQRPFRTPRDLQDEELHKFGGLRRVKNLER